MIMFSASNKVAPALNKTPVPAALDDGCLTERRLIPNFGAQSVPRNETILKHPPRSSLRVSRVPLPTAYNLCSLFPYCMHFGAISM